MRSLQKTNTAAAPDYSRKQHPQQRKGLKDQFPCYNKTYAHIHWQTGVSEAQLTIWQNQIHLGAWFVRTMPAPGMLKSIFNNSARCYNTSPESPNKHSRGPAPIHQRYRLQTANPKLECKDAMHPTKVGLCSKVHNTEAFTSCGREGPNKT